MCDFAIPPAKRPSFLLLSTVVDVIDVAPFDVHTYLKVELLRDAEHEAILHRRHHLAHGMLLVVHGSRHFPARLHVDGSVLHVDLEQLVQLFAGMYRADLIPQ